MWFWCCAGEVIRGDADFDGIRVAKWAQCDERLDSIDSRAQCFDGADLYIRTDGVGVERIIPPASFFGTTILTFHGTSGEVNAARKPLLIPGFVFLAVPIRHLLAVEEFSGSHTFAVVQVDVFHVLRLLL